MEITIDWKGGMELAASVGSKTVMTFDAKPEGGGKGNGPTPLEAFVSSLGACTAMDVLSILAKKRQQVTRYRVVVTGERAPEGEFPRPFVQLNVQHILAGEDLDPAAVARAVELSDTKYCTVSATLKGGPEIVSTWVVESGD